MYLKQLSMIQNNAFVLTNRIDIQHNNVTLQLRTKRLNCARTQTLFVTFKNAVGEDVQVGPVSVTRFAEMAFVSHYTPFRKMLLAWLKHPDTVLPVQVELALRAIASRNEYVKPISDKLRGMVDATTHPCEKVKGVSLTPNRASMVLPTIGGYYIRVDIKLKRKKYITYFSVTHPDCTTRNSQGDEIATVFTETRYGIIMGAKGFYSLINLWSKGSTSSNVAMLKAVAPELLAHINGERRQTIDDFFNIINHQVSAPVSMY